MAQGYISDMIIIWIEMHPIVQNTYNKYSDENKENGKSLKKTSGPKKIRWHRQETTTASSYSDLLLQRRFQPK